MKLNYALEIAVANELNMRDLYNDLYRVSLKDTELAQIWAFMAKEEAKHAATFHGIRRGLRPDEAENEIDFSVAPLDEFAHKIDTFKKSLETDRPSNDEIFRFVLEMELGEQNKVLLKMLKAAPSPLGKQIYNDIAKPVGHHVLGVLKLVEKRTKNEDLLAYVRKLLNK